MNDLASTAPASSQEILQKYQQIAAECGDLQFRRLDALDQEKAIGNAVADLDKRIAALRDHRMDLQKQLDAALAREKAEAPADVPAKTSET